MQRNFAALVAITFLAFGLISCKTYTSGLKGTTDAAATAATTFEDAQPIWTN